MVQLTRIGLRPGIGGGAQGGGASYDFDYIFGDICSEATYSLQPCSVYIAAIDSTIFFEQMWTGGASNNRWIYARAYNHTTRTLSGSYLVGNTGIDNDTHGLPICWYDVTTGYIYVAYGSHATSLQLSKSTNPNDFKSWSPLTALAGQHSYAKYLIPTAGANAAQHHIFTRDNNSINFRLQLTKSSSVNGSGVPTWGAVTPVIDFGNDSRVDAGPFLLASDGQNIHGVMCWANNADTLRQNVYYVIYDTGDGKFYNYNRSFSTSTFPINKTTMDANFRIVSQTTTEGNIPNFCFDTAGNSHVVYMDGPSPDGPYNCLHIWSDLSSAWSAPTTVGQFATTPTAATHRFDGLCAVKLPAGEVDVYWVTTSVPAYARGGNISRKRRAADGTFGSEVLVKAAGSTYALDAPNAVWFAHPDARVFFGEFNGDEPTENGDLKAYAYGDSGILGYDYGPLATALFPYLGSLPNNQKFAIDNFLLTAESLGWWTAKTEVFHVALNDFASASINWANPGATAGTLTQVGSPTFTALQGFKGNGSTSKYNINFVPSTHSTKASQNSQAITLVVRDNIANDAYFDYGGGSTSSSQWNGRNAAQNQHRAEIGSNGNDNYGTATVSSAGFFTLSRTANNLTTAYKSGAVVGTPSTNARAATGLPDAALHICGTTSGFSAREVQMGMHSAGLSAAEAAQVYYAWVQLHKLLLMA